MASIFTTGSEAEASAPVLAETLLGQIRDDVTAHAAWELVEEFTVSGTNWIVLKCLASVSGLSDDFYVVMGRTISTGESFFTIAEDYDAGTNVLSNFPTWNLSGSNIQYDGSGRNPVTRTLNGTNFDQNTNNAPFINQWYPQSNAVNWWIIVSEDTFTVGLNGSPNWFIHVGAYTYLGQLPNLLPIQMIGSQQWFGGITRNPAIESKLLAPTFGYVHLFYGGADTSLSTNRWTPLGFQGPWKANDALQNDQRPVAEVGMAMVPHASDDTWPAQYGFALGKQKRMRASKETMPSGFSFGDAFALNGKLWVPYKTDDGRIWDTGIASS